MSCEQQLTSTSYFPPSSSYTSFPFFLRSFLPVRPSSVTLYSGQILTAILGGWAGTFPSLPLLSLLILIVLSSPTPFPFSSFLGPFPHASVAPWKILASSGTFLTFVSGYAIFLGPFAGLLTADYYLVKRTAYHVPELYDPNVRRRSSLSDLLGET